LGEKSFELVLGEGEGKKNYWVRRRRRRRRAGWEVNS